MERKPWLARWEIVRSLSEGGHGRTYLVRPKEGGSEQVLKVLKMQQDVERRTRMALEAHALNILSHPRIAGLVESNAEQLKQDVELYLVTRFVEGPDLKKFVGGKP